MFYMILSININRSYASTLEHIQKLNLSYPVPSEKGCTKSLLPRSIIGTPVVSMNGAKCVQVKFCSETSKFDILEMCEESLPLDVTTATLTLAKKLGHCCQYYLDGEIYANPSNNFHFSLTGTFSKLTGIIQKKCNNDFQKIIDDIGLPLRLVRLCGEQNIDGTMNILTESLGPRAYILRGSTGWFVEILKKDVCKGNGLKRMCDAIDVKIEETIAFGDGCNDIEFLEMAGLGIAMKNAPQFVKEASDEITDFTNAEDGVRLKLKKLEKERKLQFGV